VYEVTKYSEEMEVTAMLGNICTMNNEPILHMHGTFGRRDNSTIGGHVVSATADPFLEVVITKTENDAVREYNKELNLNVIKNLTY
jgi:predicted DNA-binding protein with PD1-like motif